MLTYVQNQWVNPVALDSIAWKYYIVYIVLIIMYLVLIWFYFPETRRLTIEEVSIIFDTGRAGKANVAVAALRRQDEESVKGNGVVQEENVKGSGLGYVESKDSEM